MLSSCIISACELHTSKVKYYNDVAILQEPWQQYCVEPPCGQMNIINENLYPVLNKILVEYNKVFKPDLFHMGGDEVRSCSKADTRWLDRIPGGMLHNPPSKLSCRIAK